jgi:prepilin peptidase CpaA
MISTASSQTILILLGASAILIAGVIDDLRTKKFHNWLFAACCAFATMLLAIAEGAGAAPMALLGFTAGFVILLPAVLLGVIGAGDMKLLAAFGILAGWSAVLSVTLYAFVWGAAFGVLRVALNGQIRVFLSNLVAVATLKDRTQLVTHKMPFAVAIFIGWLSHLVTQGVL